MVKKKRKEKVKKKLSQNLFANGGLILLIFGGVIGIFYQTLYLLITTEALKEESLYYMGARGLQELGILLLFCTVVLGCFYYRSEKERFRSLAGYTLIIGAAIAIPSLCYLLYDSVSLLQDQTFTLRTFLTQSLPTLLSFISKIYILVGALFLGIVFTGYLKRKSWSNSFIITGALIGCAALGIFLYLVYDSYFILQEQGASRELIIARVIIPDSSMIFSYMFILAGTLLLAASHIWEKYDMRKWTGRTWLVGGITGAFYKFTSLGIGSQTIHDEILRVRQYIMELTPYSTSLNDLPLTTETLREYYIKKMIPVYMDHALWIMVFSAIALLGIYFWSKK
ncbi:MAG: hypothetical protein HXS53_03975 [Theionarchaea archaeon]|nr:hypothetical protein [Theionarchaea archaeon]